MISIRCEGLTRLKLRGCREVTEVGMDNFAKNCKNLTKFSCGSCNFGAIGINMLLKHCIKLEELTIKRLRNVNNGNDVVVPGAAALSLKSICLKELGYGQCFEPLVVECKMLKTLKVIRCAGDWDNVLVKMGSGNTFLSDVHLERLQVSDIGLGAISKCVNIDSLHIVKNPECTNLGLVSVAENCKKLRKLHIDGWKINRIGDEGLMAVSKQCPDLQELVLIGVHVTHLSMEQLLLIARDWRAKCVELKKLCIKGCAISDIAIELACLGCPNLVKVKVKKCKGVRSEAVDWLARRKGSLIVSFDAIESEGLDASGSDVGGQESGVGIPVTGGNVVVGDGPSVSSGRLALFRAKLGLFASRNLVPCAFHRVCSCDSSFCIVQFLLAVQ
uniref:COI1 F-box domain-containing protein n=1 Tax=Salix viminalis TaxID=40686 RepID=A0A6N2MFL5_SALVM